MRPNRQPQEEHLRARQLLAMNPSERRIAIRKQAKTTVDFSTDPRVLRAYRRLEGVAEWPQLKEFRLSAEELAECVQTKKQRLLETQTKSAAGGQRQVIPNGDALVTWCVHRRALARLLLPAVWAVLAPWALNRASTWRYSCLNWRT